MEVTVELLPTLLGLLDDFRLFLKFRGLGTEISIYSIHFLTIHRIYLIYLLQGGQVILLASAEIMGVTQMDHHVLALQRWVAGDRCRVL